MSVEGQSPLLPANIDPARIAIRGLSRSALTYGDLDQQARYTIDALNNHGIGRNDRIASALPDSPIDCAMANILASGFSFVPQNPDQPQAKFEADFRDLGVKALLVEPYTQDTPAVAAARKHNVPIIVVQDRGIKAGEFTLDFGSMPERKITTGGFNILTDESIIMRTSGTTSGNSKTVPHPLQNVLGGISHFVQSVGLTRDDRGFCTGLGFHVHKRMGGTLAPLFVGSEIFCPPKYSTSNFFSWFAEAKPTWMTTVSAQYHFILEQAKKPENAAIMAEHGPSVRLLRASSTPLPAPILHAMEAAFVNAVAVEAYSMSENAHVVCSNPPDRNLRKAGTVGFPVNGVDLLLIDENTFEPVPHGEVGRIAFKSNSLFSGYENDPDENAKSFTPDGYFMPTDYGKFDKDGHLVFFGRNTDIIDRAGENISAPWIDATMLLHPAVAEAMAFGIPDPVFHNKVGVAVVLRDGLKATKNELRTHIKDRMESFNIPSEIVFVPEIPKNDVGKPVRRNAAQHFGIAS